MEAEVVYLNTIAEVKTLGCAIFNLCRGVDIHLADNVDSVSVVLERCPSTHYCANRWHKTQRSHSKDTEEHLHLATLKPYRERYEQSHTRSKTNLCKNLWQGRYRCVLCADADHSICIAVKRAEHTLKGVVNLNISIAAIGLDSVTELESLCLVLG